MTMLDIVMPLQSSKCIGLSKRLCKNNNLEVITGKIYTPYKRQDSSGRHVEFLLQNQLRCMRKTRILQYLDIIVLAQLTYTGHIYAYTAMCP